MPRIQLVTIHYPPALDVGARRAARIARHLSALGWEVDVLTVRSGLYSHRGPALERAEGPSVVRTGAIVPKQWGRLLRERFRARAPRVDGVERTIHAGGGDASVPRPRGPLTRAWDAFFSIPDEWAGWIPLALSGAMVRGARPDLVVATSPPFTAAIAAAIVARLRKVPLVLDYRDPWTTSSYTRPLPGWRRMLDRSLEIACLRRASLVVTTTPSVARSIDTISGAPKVVVTNASDADELGAVEPVKFDRFTILHAGNFYASRSVESILLALRELVARDGLPPRGIALRLVGVNGPEVPAAAGRLGLGSLLEMEGPVSFRDAFARMKGADVLLLVVGREHGGLVPAKLFDYLAARRFVLGIVPPGAEAARLIEELGIGTTVLTDDIPGMVDVLRRRIAAASAEVTPSPSAARFGARRTMEGLSQHLRELLDRGNRGHASKPPVPSLTSSGAGRT